MIAISSFQTRSPVFAIVKILAFLSPVNSMLRGRSCNASNKCLQQTKDCLLLLQSEDVFSEIADAAGFTADAERNYQQFQQQSVNARKVVGSMVECSIIQQKYIP